MRKTIPFLYLFAVMVMVYIGIPPALAADSIAKTGVTSSINIIEEDIAYAPEDMVVHVGQSIKVHNNDPFDHKSRVTRHTADGGLGQIVINDHLEKPDSTFTFQLKKAGVYQIRCMLHDGMESTIKVIE